MKTIHKYALPQSGIWTVALPTGAEALHVDLDPSGQLSLWALVDTDQVNYTNRTFHVIGTGRRVPDNLKHLGTVRQADFMWHVFEEVVP